MASVTVNAGWLHSSNFFVLPCLSPIHPVQCDLQFMSVGFVCLWTPHLFPTMYCLKPARCFYLSNTEFLTETFSTLASWSLLSLYSGLQTRQRQANTLIHMLHFSQTMIRSTFKPTLYHMSQTDIHIICFHRDVMVKS